MAKKLHEATWNLQDAKAKLSEVVDLAQSGSVQFILRRGKPAAAVVSISEYEALRPRKALLSFLLHSPLVHSGLDLTHADKVYEPRSDIFDDEQA